MHISDQELARYEVGEVLGEGADLQVFAARDRSTGAYLVLKRPHPALLSRNQHQDVEARTRNSATLRHEFGGDLPHLPSLLGVSELANHDSMFGDVLSHEYTVTVHTRAEGVPLVGEMADALKKQPIGLPINLFCLHPLRSHVYRGETPILMDVLETVESFHRIGYLLMDLRPQNVFYSPRTGDVSIIDVGDFRKPQEATRRHPPLEMHDMFLDLFGWYVPARDPPLDFDSWTEAVEPQRSPQFERGVDDTRRLFDREEPTQDRVLAIQILDRIKARGYSHVSGFKSDINELLTLRRLRLASSPDLDIQLSHWERGIAMMRDDYWGKFLFSAQPDLETYEIAFQ